MKVIIKKTNQVEEVNDSYAVNFLIPKGLAIKVTDKIQKELDEKQAEKDQERDKLSEKQNKIAKEIDDKEFVIKSKANDQGELYAGITEKQIKKLIGLKRGISVKMRNPIKKIGKYEIEVKIGESKVKINLVIKEE